MEQTEQGAWLVLRLHMKSPEAAMQAMQQFCRRDKLNAFKAPEPRIWELYTDQRPPHRTRVGTAEIINKGGPDA